MSNHDELVEQFIMVSGVDSDRAKFFLESAAWDLTTALASFYEDSEQGMPADDPHNSGESRSQAAGGSSRPNPNISFVAPDDDEDEDDNESSSEEEEGQTFYAGGSRTSGQQIVGPGKKKKDVVGRLMKAAKAQGAEVVGGEDAEGRRAVRQSFRGTSYRLGENENDTQVIPDPHASREDQSQTVSLALYREGFTVDDGPLRLFTEPDNMRFITDIKNGRIPMELVKNNKNREVSITMKDLRDQKYSPPKTSLKAFSGAGHSLGSPAPAVVGQVPYLPGPGGSAAPADPSACETMAKSVLSVDAAQPTTNIQMRLTDGSRLIVHANHHHTVGHLRTYLTTARPQYASSPVALMTTFPHAELADDAKTLKEANILNAAIVVKYK